MAAGVIVLTDRVATPPRNAVSRLMLGLALALSAVAMLRDSSWLVALCLLAAVGLTSAAALHARSWSALMLSLPVLGIMLAPAATWLVGTARRVRRPQAEAAWARGAGLAAGSAVVFGGLLAWADPIFAVLLARLTPAPDLLKLPGQLLVGGLTACLAGGLAYAAVCRPRWERQTRAPRSRPAVEWALPLAVVDVVLLAFGAVQAAVQFHEYTPSLAGKSYATLAREGFWQLSAVTLLDLGDPGLGGAAGGPDLAAAPTPPGRHRWTAGGAHPRRGRLRATPDVAL